jgi:DNA-binding NtrC family response regulator/pSer/pThr/pTyr-binding forkhead associated (FHA) protein
MQRESAAHRWYTIMATEHLTLDAGTLASTTTEPRAYLVVHLGEDAGSRVIDLADGGEVTFGRSRSAIVTVKHDNVSRLHARISRTGDTIAVEDTGSRNGTFVNGERIAAKQRVSPGDEIVIGSIHVVVGATSGLRRASPIATAEIGDARMIAEVDRAMRYRRSVTFALVRTPVDAAIEAMAAVLRPMDMIAEVVADDYLVILPELDRESSGIALASLLDAAKLFTKDVRVASAVCPDHGTTVERLVGVLRTTMRTGRPADQPPSTHKSRPVVLDPAMKRVYALVDKVADTALTVLVLGETGVGKELVAEAIHRASGRKSKPFVKLNCAALPETLLESELFGHERGAFTGADRKKLGFFEAANGGTLFLDEIGEVSPSMQAKLLRVLERKVITRVGSTAETAVDVRLLAATHRDLDAACREGGFRQDLLFRLTGFTIAIPPLRDRTIEIVPLAEHFASLAAAEQGRAVPELARDAQDVLVAYGWPGNVRELVNAIERAMVMCGDSITAADLPESLRDPHHYIRPVATPISGIQGHLAELERDAIARALAANGNNQTRTAKALGLSRRTLIYKLEKFGLKLPPKSD